MFSVTVLIPIRLPACKDWASEVFRSD
jgi:hypothetical protein